MERMRDYQVRLYGQSIPLLDENQERNNDYVGPLLSTDKWSLCL